MTDRDHQPNQPAGEAPLQGWKEIAAYLGRDARTAQRWEASAGLPVRRHGGSAGSVYAYPSELQSWRASRRTKPGGEAASTPAREQPRRRLISALAIAGTVVVALLVIRFGPVLNPPSPIAQAAEDSVRTELVWPEARGFSTQGSPSPDGKFVTYVDWVDEGNLAIRNLETGEDRRLTHTADGNTGFNDNYSYTGNSRVSPDGKQVVYTWAIHPRPGIETGELRLLSLDDAATEPHTVWSPAEGTWASIQDWFPDGGRVAAIVTKSPTDHQIVTVSVTDGNVRQIRSIDWSDSPRVRVSPDGRHIAYSRSASRDQAAKDIFVVAVDGSSESAVVEHAANDELVGWSPKGDYLVVNSDRGGQPGLWVQPLENAEAAGRLRLIVPNVDVAAGMGMAQDGSLYYSVRVTPQRLKLAEIDWQSGKFLAETKNAVERFVGRNSTGEFSPDGEKFAYVSRRKEAWNRPAIIVRTIATGDEREVPHHLRGAWSLIWQPDGNSLIVQASDDRGRYGYFDVSLANGQARLLVKRAYAGVLSPDGESLLHRSSEGENGSIYSYRLSDGSVETVPGKFAGRIGVSPDGRIAAVLHRTEVRLYPAAGGEGKVLWQTAADPPLGRWTLWTADGKALLVPRRDPDAGQRMWRVWVVPVDGLLPYSTDLVYETSGGWPPDIHPDGKRILYTEGTYFWQVWVMRNLPFDPREQAAE